jgi:transcription initiation factor IIE alpha subunit
MFRKLCRDCKKVLDYLAISEVIETMEDLVQFVKDLRNKADLLPPSWTDSN